jgi:hypothetical protein
MCQNDLICAQSLVDVVAVAAVQIGGYLESPLSMPRLTRTSAAFTCHRGAFGTRPQTSKSAATRGFVPGLRRRRCPGNASTT